jgi:hypothetical protein
MKVLKILAIVLGAITLLTGVGMFLGSAAISKGSGALNTQMSQQGFVGPVEGVVKAIDPTGAYSVVFNDQQGVQHTGTGAAATSKPKIGDTVTLFYYRDNPETVVIADLGSVGTILRTGGLITGGVGAVLLLAGVLGLLLGRKAPSVAGYPAQAYPQPYPPQQYPPQAYPPQQYPPVPAETYPPVPTQTYPPQQYPSQQYPPPPPQQ